MSRDLVLGCEGFYSIQRLLPSSYQQNVGSHSWKSDDKSPQSACSQLPAQDLLEQELEAKITGFRGGNIPSFSKKDVNISTWKTTSDREFTCVFVGQHGAADVRQT